MWRSSSRAATQCEVRFNWFTLYYRYQTVDTYFGTSFYTLDISRRATSHHEEEGHSQERLHPPRRGHLPRVGANRDELSDRTELRGRGDAVHRDAATDETGGRRVLPVRINIPLDCRDGVCGTCKSFCESGEYELGEYVVDEAMTADEEAEGYVLTCQMTPKSDCVIRIPTTSDVAKTGVSAYTGGVSVDRPPVGRRRPSSRSRSTTAARWASCPASTSTSRCRAPTRPARTRSVPGRGPTRPAFLLRNTPTGALPTYLRERAKEGDRIEFQGPLGSFYLRPSQRPAPLPGRRHRPGAVPVDAGQAQPGRQPSTRST